MTERLRPFSSDAARCASRAELSSVAVAFAEASAIERLKILEDDLVRRVRIHPERNRIAIRVAELIEQKEGAVRVRDVARECGVSERTLRTKFDEWAGVTPKQYARLVRLRACLARLAVPRSDWAALAVECGFCDQAHMIHEFRALLGTTPAAFVRREQPGAGSGPSGPGS